jgi:hypothetical protein
VCFGGLEVEDAVNTAEAIRYKVLDIATSAARAAEAWRQQQARFYGDQALAMLRTAVARGYKDAAHMKEDKDLDPLRGRGDFQKLLAELEAAARPKEGARP